MAAKSKYNQQRGARGRKQAGNKPDVFTNPEARGDQVYGAIYGALRPLDEMRERMESKWGRERLETLVPPEIATKFCAVRERLNAAIDAGDQNLITHEAGILYRGWIAMDEAALRAGREVVPSGVWSFTSDGGDDYRITLTDEDKFGLCASLAREEAARVLSIEELLRIYENDKHAIVREAMRCFPGANITSTEGSKAIAEGKKKELDDDEIPF